MNRPQRQATNLLHFGALARSYLATPVGAVRKFVKDDLRQDTIKLRDLPWTARVLVWLGFALLAAMVSALIFSDPVRAWFPLLTVPEGGTVSNFPAERGVSVPAVLVPATLLLLSISLSFVLTGALHAHPAIRLGTFFLYLLTVAVWLYNNYAGIDFDTGGFPDFYGPWGIWGLLLAVLVFFALRWWGRPRPVLEFTILLMMVSGTFLVAQHYELGSEWWRIDDVSFVLPSLTTMVGSFQYLSILLLLIIGIDIAEFLFRMTNWATNVTSARSRRWVLGLLLVLVLVWSLYGGAQDSVEGLRASSLSAELTGYAGALGVPLLVGLVWWFVMRRQSERPDEPLDVEQVLEVGKKAAILLIIPFFVLLWSDFFFDLTFYSMNAVPIMDLTEPANKVNELLYGLHDPWDPYEFSVRSLLAGLSLVLAFLLVRRGRRYLALYLGVFGAVELWIQLTGPDAPLGALEWKGPEHAQVTEIVYGGGRDMVNIWWVVILALVGLVWLIRGRLTTERVQRLLLLLLITALMQRMEFLEDPTSVVPGLTGVGIVIAFGIIWDVLTAGSWTNMGSAALPRLSRIFLYLGFVLFSVTVVNWSVATHNLYEVEALTGGTALNALDIFGKPLLYTIFAVTLALPAKPPPQDLDPPKPVQG